MKIKLVDLVIQINDDNEKLSTFFNDYIVDGNPDIVLDIKNDDIEYEKKQLPASKLSDFEYYLLAIYRKIAEILPKFDAFLFHGSAIYYDLNATILTGPSGAGKSTHASLLKKHKNINIINDDKPIIRLIDDIPYVYGTPWDGKHHLSQNISKPLKSIIFIEKDTNNKIIDLNKEDAFFMMLEQTYRPINNKDNIVKTIELLDKVVKATYQYKLYCDISKQSAEISFEIIK